MTRIDDEAFDPWTYAIIGAAQEVHRVLGPGFLEIVYHLALANELRRRQVMFELEVELPVIYKGDDLGCKYRVDLLVGGDVIVELKALKSLGPIEEAQTLNYLKASSLEVGLLLNFGAQRLEVQRFVMGHATRASASSVPSVVPGESSLPPAPVP